MKRVASVSQDFHYSTTPFFWTFAVSKVLRAKNLAVHTHDNWNYSLPEFVGSNYFCESGDWDSVTVTDTNDVFLADPS